jgi:hypothetical protein
MQKSDTKSPYVYTKYMFLYIVIYSKLKNTRTQDIR